MSNPFEPPAWMDDALCAQVDTDLFFPNKGESAAPAKSICNRCPAVEACLQFALDHDERYGVYGGKSERERRILSKDRVAKKNAKLAARNRDILAASKAGATNVDIAGQHGLTPYYVSALLSSLRAGEAA